MLQNRKKFTITVYTENVNLLCRLFYLSMSCICQEVWNVFVNKNFSLEMLLSINLHINSKD